VLGCGDEPPGPGDPSYGTAAEVLVTQCDGGELLWVGINAPPTPTPPPPGRGGAAQEGPVFDEFEALRCAGDLNWIGGTVVVAAVLPNGFSLDPSHILVPDRARAEIQTTISSIASDPRFFPEGGAGGEQHWVVPASVLAIETSVPLLCPIAPACGDGTTQNAI